jgi:Cdc6-like AAA superfamily ATPase
LAQRAENTGDWLKETNEFKRWVTGNSSALLCQGPPGVGKTVLASIIVDHLQSTISSDTRVLAFSCNHSDIKRNQYRTLLGSFLQQLIKYPCSSWESIKAMFKRHQNGTQPKKLEFLTLLQNEMKNMSKAYVILDAFDEWSTDPGEDKEKMDIDPPKSDLETYLRSRLMQENNRSLLGRSSELRSMATDRILASCEGL